MTRARVILMVFALASIFLAIASCDELEAYSEQGWNLKTDERCEYDEQCLSRVCAALGDGLGRCRIPCITGSLEPRCPDGLWCAEWTAVDRDVTIEVCTDPALIP